MHNKQQHAILEMRNMIIFMYCYVSDRQDTSTYVHFVIK